jgi:hypothetical protein
LGESTGKVVCGALQKYCVLKKSMSNNKKKLVNLSSDHAIAAYPRPNIQEEKAHISSSFD